MTIEFVDSEIQSEYDDLLMQEEFLLGELGPVQERIREIEQQYDKQ